MKSALSPSADKPKRPEKTHFDCEHCSEKFTNVIELWNHMVFAHQSPQIFCEFCGHHIETSEFLRHVQLCEGTYKEKFQGNKYECDMCRKTFTKPSTKNYHIRKVHKKITYDCQHCGQSFSAKPSRDQHVQVKHEGILFYCEHCGQSFNSKQNMDYHKSKHHNIGTKYYCDRCPASFPRACDVRYHNCEAVEQWKKVEENRKQKRMMMEDVDFEPTKTKVHKEQAPKLFHCDHCVYVGASNKLLKLHKRRQHQIDF